MARHLFPELLGERLQGHRPEIGSVAGANGHGPVFQLPPPENEERGVVIPAAMAFLGLSFVSCALLITGLPPLLLITA